MTDFERLMFDLECIRILNQETKRAEKGSVSLEEKIKELRARRGEV